MFYVYFGCVKNIKNIELVEIISKLIINKVWLILIRKVILFNYIEE